MALQLAQWPPVKVARWSERQSLMGGLVEARKVLGALGAGTPECLGPALLAVSPSPMCVARAEHRSSVP